MKAHLTAMLLLTTSLFLFEIPVTKTPLFAGGTGIVPEKIDGELMARIYPVATRAETDFFARDGKTT